MIDTTSNRGFIYFTGLCFLLFSCQIALSQPPSSPMHDSEIARPSDEDSGEDNDAVEVVIPSTGGLVRWADVATEVADQLKLDRDSLQQMMPSGSVDLRSGTVMLTLIAINLAAGDAISFSIGNEPAGRQVLKVRCRRSFFTGVITATPKKSATVDLDSDWIARTSGKPLLIFLHGMNSDASVFDAMRSAIRTDGFATASIGYDYRQSIADSARHATATLGTALGTKAATPSICLIGHSMGGLVARQMCEGTDLGATGLAPKRIKQLITIGTPHQGSNWASLPPLSDMFSADGMDPSDLMDVILHQPSSAGIRDLIPGSAFLKALNARPRRPDVRYTAIIGTASPVDASEVDALQQTLRSLDQDGSVVRLIRPRIQPLLESFDEMTAGKGDGIVSVESAKLPGVDDNIEIAVSHFEMIQKGKTKGADKVLKILRARIASTTDKPVPGG